MVRNRLDRENRILNYLYMNEKNTNFIHCSGGTTPFNPQNFFTKGENLMKGDYYEIN